MKKSVQQYFSNRPTFYFVLAASIMVVCFVSGYIFQQLYFSSPSQEIDIKRFERVLHKKETMAVDEIDRMIAATESGQFNSIIKNRDFYRNASENDLTFLLLKNNKPVFWSNNRIDFSDTDFSSVKQKFIHFPNAYCVCTWKEKDEHTYIALIKIKNDYSYENDFFRNDYAAGFELDKQVLIEESSPQNEEAVFSVDGDYLFSLSNNTDIYNESYSYASLIFFSFGFILFLILFCNIHLFFRKNKLPFQYFLLSSICLLVLTYGLLRLRFPALFFTTTVFSSLTFAASEMLPSLGHLLFYTLTLLACSFLFYSYTSFPRIQNRSIARITYLFFAALFTGCFICIIYMLNVLIQNSSFSFVFTKLTDFSMLHIIAYLLILYWFSILYFIAVAIIKNYRHILSVKYQLFSTGIIFLAACCAVYFLKQHWAYTAVLWCLLFYAVIYIVNGNKTLRSSRWSVFLYSLLVAVTATFYGSQFNEEKEMKSFQLLSENIFLRGNNEEEPIARVLLEDMDVRLKNDSAFQEKLRQKNFDLDDLYQYLTKNYFKGYWKKFDFYLLTTPVHPTQSQTNDAAFYHHTAPIPGVPIKDTYFSVCMNPVENLRYIGEIPFLMENKIPTVLFIGFYTKTAYRTYGPQENIIESVNDGSIRDNISIAWYEKNEIRSFSGKYQYLYSTDWIPEHTDSFFHFSYNGYKHYVSVSDNDRLLVISNPESPGAKFIFSFTYLFLFYFILCMIGVVLFRFMTQPDSLPKNIYSRLQSVFTILFLFSFTCIGIFSVFFFAGQFHNRQADLLQTKAQFIRKTLEYEYGNNERLLPEMSNELNFFSQDLANQLQIDLHLYDLDGELIATSRPTIFSERLISNRLTSRSYFGRYPERLIEDFIGNLKYLSYYTTFYNDNNERMGYIVVPSFISNDEMQQEIFTFLSIIIDVYFLIALISLLASILISKQLSKPLKMIRSKLQTLQLENKNERIDYENNDEIGELVAQYNIMVDQLEISAKALADSERESAWREMARQIAHEIKNPLTPMKLTLQQLQRFFSNEKGQFEHYFPKASTMLIEQIDTLSQVANTFYTFANTYEIPTEPVDIVKAIHSAAELFQNNESNIRIRIELNEISSLFIHINKEQLRQVLNNLIKNAIQASNENGEVTVSLNKSEDKIMLTITDHGKGIPATIRHKIFQPSFTTKSSGMGLGLAISKNIISSIGGDITFETGDNGTRFMVTFNLL